MAIENRIYTPKEYAALTREQRNELRVLRSHSSHQHSAADQPNVVRTKVAPIVKTNFRLQ